MKRIHTLLILLIATALGIAGCDGSDPTITADPPAGAEPTDPLMTLLGQVVKGPVTGATVIVFRLDTMEELDRTMTDENGDYQVSFRYQGAVLFEVTGGEYIDEATGQPVPLDTPLRSVTVADLVTEFAYITPLTEVAARTVLESSATPTDDDIEAANQAVASAFAIDGTLVAVPPADLTAADTGDDDAAARYGLVLAAFSQMLADDASLDLATLVAAVANDVMQDGTLSEEELVERFARAAKTFVDSEQNASDTGTTDIDDIIASNTRPLVDAGEDFVAEEQTTIEVTGTGSDLEGPVTFSWAQVSGMSVVITDPTSPTLSFTTPDLVADQTLTFELTVADSDGATRADQVTITVTYDRIAELVDDSQSLLAELQAAHASLVLVPGDTGPMGDQGPQGDTGPIGNAGLGFTPEDEQDLVDLIDNGNYNSSSVSAAEYIENLDEALRSINPTIQNVLELLEQIEPGPSTDVPQS